MAMIPGAMALLVVSAFVCTIIAGMGKCPLWIPVLLLCVAMLLGVVPR